MRVLIRLHSNVHILHCGRHAEALTAGDARRNWPVWVAGRAAQPSMGQGWASTGTVGLETAISLCTATYYVICRGGTESHRRRNASPILTPEIDSRGVNYPIYRSGVIGYTSGAPERARNNVISPEVLYNTTAAKGLINR